MSEPKPSKGREVWQNRMGDLPYHEPDNRGILLVLISIVIGAPLFFVALVYSLDAILPEYKNERDSDQYETVIQTRQSLVQIRSALKQYWNAKKRYPRDFNSLLEEPFREGKPLLEKMPSETLSRPSFDDNIKSNHKVVNRFDGTGGWFYNPKTGEVKPNITVDKVPSNYPGKPLSEW